MLKKGLLAILILTLLGACASQDQKQAVMHYKLGLSHLENQKLQAAFIEFNKALEYDKGNKDIYSALGYIYFKFDELEKAEEMFWKAISIDSEYSDAYNNICNINYKRREFQKALLNCGKALQNPLYETPQKAYYNLGNTLYRLKRYPEAIKSYKDAIKRDGGFFPAYYGLALASNANGEYGPASDALEKAVKLDPQFGGDMRKAEEKIKKRAASPVDEEDMLSLLDIFRY